VADSIDRALDALCILYRGARRLTVLAGDGQNVAYFSGLTPDLLLERDFLREVTFAIFCSGFREATLQRKWPALRRAFDDWDSPEAILHSRDLVRAQALDVFNSERKVDAALTAVEMVAADGWDQIQDLLAQAGPHYLTRFPMIGPVTCYHVARNLGIDCVKPDRHLLRIAEAAGYEGQQGPDEMCRMIGAVERHRIGVVDFCLWRWATLTPDYVARVRATVEG
jgi:hypothetical protein